MRYRNQRELESSTEEGDSPVDETRKLIVMIQSTTRHVKPCGKQEGPPSKPKYYLVTDSEEVPWGKGEKNPGRGVKKNLKPYVYKQWKHFICATAYFL